MKNKYFVIYCRTHNEGTGTSADGLPTEAIKKFREKHKKAKCVVQYSSLGKITQIKKAYTYKREVNKHAK